MRVHFTNYSLVLSFFCVSVGWGAHPCYIHPLYTFNSENRMLILRHRRAFCGPSMSGYESRAIPNDIKEEHENRRNQQVYSASPVKTVDKGNESGK